MPEILAPGGSFASAIAALEHGADALYCGLPRFSARKGAQNLNLEQLYRLREFAEKSGKKIYLALNTLILDQEWAELYLLLKQLEPLQPQGIILQDLGLLRFLKEEFPAFPLHGSTQLSLHNSAGVHQAQKLGLERVVLSRECSLDQITAIRKDCPEMALEVFVHGALCVSFSGLCFASGKLLDRSANRGECGQVCRSWFDRQGDQAFHFSARDLELGKDILKLKEAGVASLKIEGRMKGPEYAAWTSAYYRAILDEAPGKEIDRLRQLSRQAFSRESTQGWFFSSRGDSMIQSDEPGHRGIPLGTVEPGNRICLESELSQRDGLLFLPPGRGQQIPRPKRFSARFTGIDGQKIYHAAAGDRIRFQEKLAPEGKLFRISRHDQAFPEIKEQRFPLYRPPVKMNLSWEQGNLRIHSEFPFAHGDLSWKVEWQKSRKRDFPDQWKKLFQEAPGGPAEVVEIHWGEKDWKELFVPLSRLKEIRREYRKDLESLLFTPKVPPSSQKRPWSPQMGKDFPMRELLNHRETLNPRNDKLPFLLNPQKADWKDFTSQGNSIKIPLNPIQMEKGTYLKELIHRIEQEPERSFCLGLNNLSHLSLCQRFREEKRITFWVDYGLYCANGSAASFFMEQIPRLEGILYWIEGPREEGKELGLSVSTSFTPPLFSSAVCFHRHSLGLGCPGGCSKYYEYNLNQRDRQFQVLVRDCWSYLLEQERD